MSAARSPTLSCSTGMGSRPRRCRPREPGGVRARRGRQAVGARDVERFTHGTTVATNALLERKGARRPSSRPPASSTCCHLRRQRPRAHLYRLLRPTHPEPLAVRSSAASAYDERIGPGRRARGRSTSTRCRRSTRRRSPCAMLFSFRDAAARARRSPSELRRRCPAARVVASHEVAPEFREYERGVDDGGRRLPAARRASRYLDALARALRRRGARRAARHALVGRRRDARRGGGASRLSRCVSGPAAGVVGAALGSRAGRASRTRSRSTWAAHRPTSA